MKKESYRRKIQYPENGLLHLSILFMLMQGFFLNQGQIYIYIYICIYAHTYIDVYVSLQNAAVDVLKIEKNTAISSRLVMLNLYRR